jgi:RNA polymerase sigma factor (sigma-70 family)
VNQYDAIVLYRPLLHSIALKIVGSIQDAEDIVQDTFEKWLSIDSDSINNTKAYLIRSVSNNAIQFLNSWKQKLSEQSDPCDEVWLEDEQQRHQIFHFDVESQLQQAWAVLHKKLEPVEKSVFVMRTAFNLEYEELQHLYDKKVDHIRKIFSRALQKIKSETDKIHFDHSISEAPRVFIEACRTGKISEIVAELKKDISAKFPSKK